jgi:hypothetical protein
MSETKICSKCGEEKSLDFFKKHKRQCKECLKIIANEYRIKHKDRTKQIYEENKEKIKEEYVEKTKELNKYYEDNKNEPKTCNECGIEKTLVDFYIGKHICKSCSKVKGKIYKEENREKLRDNSRLYTHNNKDKKKKYDDDNKDAIIDYQKKYRVSNKDRRRFIYNNNPIIKTRTLIRNAIGRVCYGGVKTGKSFELLGCDIEFFMSHIESKFTEEMSWDNQGSYWHIDHIKPISKFNDIATCPIEQRLCSNWRNLQPLEATTNLIKNDKWDNMLEENIHHEEYLTESLINLDLSTIELIIDFQSKDDSYE